MLSRLQTGTVAVRSGAAQSLFCAGPPLAVRGSRNNVIDYDDADRIIASVDAGTKGGAGWTRPSTVPTSSATLLVANYASSWTPDGLGNFTSITTDGSTQTRSVNQENEYTSISGSGTIRSDANGNLTADGSGNTYVYDAWNRLVEVSNGGVTIASYGSDGLGRRIRTQRCGGQSGPGCTSGYSSGF